MRISSARSTKSNSVLAVFVALAFCPLIHAQNQAQTQTQSPPCADTTASSGTTQNSSSPSISQSAQNVANAAKNLGSLFKKKKTTQANSAAATPCSSPSPALGATNANAPNTATAPAQTNSAQPATSATPDAPAANPTPDGAAAPSQGASEPWKPPSESPSAAVVAAGPLDPAKLPDVLGIHLGTPREAASAALLKIYPGHPVWPEGPDTVAGMSMTNIDFPGKSGADNVHLEFTLPPGKQRVYYIERGLSYKQRMARSNVLDSLHQKYGQELWDNPYNGDMFWLFDEQGHLIAPDKNTTRSPYGCEVDDATGKMLFHNQVNAYLHGSLPPASFCDSFIVLRVSIDKDQSVNRIFSVLEDRALLRREVTAAGEAAKTQSEKQQQQELKNAQQAKPVL